MFLILLSALAIVQIEALSETDFRLELHKKCFSEENPSLWNPGSAVSIENFIYIVEKLERNHDIKTEDLVRQLLAQFSCNRLEFKGNDWSRVETGRVFEIIMTQFLGDSNVQLSLTDEDECQLFFMLSQAIQKVKNSGNSGIDEKNNFYEHGVVSVNADNERAIDLSKLLYGILAGFQDGKIKKVRDFEGFKSGKHDDEELDMLYSSTLSEVINTAAEMQQSGTKEWYSYKGEWSSTLCPKEYIHDNEITWPTTAEVAGAVDGYELGSKIRDMANRNDLKLSQILRMYYSKEGFKKDSADQSGTSYCTRSSISLDTAELGKQTINYMVVYRNALSKPALEKEENIVKELVTRFKPAEILQQTTAEKKACQPQGIHDRGKDTCETPSNVFAFLDRRDNNITRQETILGELINEMNVGLDEDTITIYLNEDVENLKLLVNASDSKAESTCTLEDYESYGTQNTAADSKVLTDIQNILSSYEENQKSLLAVPAKVVVVFNVGDFKPEEKNNLETAARKLKRRHPYFTMIPVGRNPEYLKEYFSNPQKNNFLSLYDSNLLPDLRKTICEAPAVLQYSNCRTKSSFQETKYKGYIRDQHVQYFTMYPKDFLKTFSYKFEFKAQYGNIRVCFSRKEPIRESGESPKCRGPPTEGNSIVFSESNPCKGRTVYNCDPFYFSIFGRDSTNGEACKREIDGKNVGCKRSDQIEYTISHEGISCSSAKQLISSPLFQTLLTLLITFYVLAWKK